MTSLPWLWDLGAPCLSAKNQELVASTLEAKAAAPCKALKRWDGLERRTGEAIPQFFHHFDRWDVYHETWGGLWHCFTHMPYCSY